MRSKLRPQGGAPPQGDLDGVGYGVPPAAAGYGGFLAQHAGTLHWPAGGSCIRSSSSPRARAPATATARRSNALCRRWPRSRRPSASRPPATRSSRRAPCFPQLSAFSDAKARAACSAVKAVLALVLVKTEAPVAFKADTLCALIHGFALELSMPVLTQRRACGRAAPRRSPAVLAATPTHALTRAAACA